MKTSQKKYRKPFWFLSLMGILVVVLSVQSCSDLMDVQPETEITGDQFFNSAEELDMYLNGLINWPGFSGIFLEASDDATTSGTAEYRNMMTNDLTSRQISSGWDWGYLRDVNYFLEYFDKADIPEADLNHYEGVARFHRARFYMNKIQRFGDVPWYDYVLKTDDEELYKPRDSREDVIEKVFEDYAFAAEHVRDSSPVGGVDSWVVRTFMARHALYEGTFRKYHDYLGLSYQRFLEIARDQSQIIIDNGGFDIYSTGNPDSDYGSLFINTNLTNNPEVILVNRGIDGERNSGWGSTGFGGYEQSPTKDLLQTYLMADGSYYSDQTGWETRSFVNEFQNRDPRLFQTFAYPGWVLGYTSSNVQGTIDEPYVQNLSEFFTGYHLIKWFPNTTDAVYQRDIDVPVLRYAEVLLTYAEAKAELGEITQADLDKSINRLRDRAGVSHMTMSPKVDPVQQDRYPGVSSTLLEIRRERRVELAFEDQRFTDLMRYRAGHLLEQLPTGIYFEGLGNHDLTGDSHPDIKLIPHTESIPSLENREINDLGETLTYYRAGPFDSDAEVFLEDGDSGNIIARNDMGTFQDPKFYYRPIPYRATQINPALEQIFGWE